MSSPTNVPAAVEAADVFDLSAPPEHEGATFACSWSGDYSGQLIVRGRVLHVSSGEVTAAVPAERLQGWTARPIGEAIELTLRCDQPVQIMVPQSFLPGIERALQRMTATTCSEMARARPVGSTTAIAHVASSCTAPPPDRGSRN